jgi:hypothetical protein
MYALCFEVRSNFSQSVCLGIEHPCGTCDRYYFMSECCLKFAVLCLWGALSDEKTDLEFAVYSLKGSIRAEPVSQSQSYFTTDSQYVLVSGTPLGPMTRFYFFLLSCWKIALLSSWCALSDVRTGLLFVVQSISGQSRGGLITIHYCLIWDYWVPFPSPLTTQGLRWKYSYPPPHGETRNWLAMLIYTFGVLRRYYVTEGFYYWEFVSVETRYPSLYLARIPSLLRHSAARSQCTLE